MLSILYGVLGWAMTGLIPTVLVGAGLSLATYTGLSPLIDSMLQNAVNSLSGMPLEAVQWTLLAGVGEALSILGSAILSRLTIVSLTSALGLTRTT